MRVIWSRDRLHRLTQLSGCLPPVLCGLLDELSPICLLSGDTPAASRGQTGD